MKNPAQNPAFDEFLASYSSDVQELARGTRTLVLEAIPGAVELVDRPSKIIAYGYGTKYADLICAIAPYKDYLNIIFGRGIELPDPEGLLSGTGKRARHVKIETTADVERPGVRALLEAALANFQRRN
jgi:hypothetical protein